MSETIEEKICNLISPILSDLGYEIVKIIFKGALDKTLSILIERQDGTGIKVEDCKRASKNISAILDVEDFWSDKYYLEVSSPGVERPLISLKDYTKFIGRVASIKLSKAIDDSKRLTGKIVKVEHNLIYLESDQKLIELDFDLIKSGKLKFTDEMFRELLKK